MRLPWSAMKGGRRLAWKRHDCSGLHVAFQPLCPEHDISALAEALDVLRKAAFTLPLTVDWSPAAHRKSMPDMVPAGARHAVRLEFDPPTVPVIGNHWDRSRPEPCSAVLD